MSFIMVQTCKQLANKTNSICQKKYILFVGDRVTYKNFLNLLRAFSSISQTNPHLFLICTGKPLERE